MTLTIFATIIVEGIFVSCQALKHYYMKSLPIVSCSFIILFFYSIYNYCFSHFRTKKIFNEGPFFQSAPALRTIEPAGYGSLLQALSPRASHPPAATASGVCLRPRGRLFASSRRCIPWRAAPASSSAVRSEICLFICPLSSLSSMMVVFSIVASSYRYPPALY